MSSFAALLTPIGAAWLISVSGGISIKGLRPLYGVQFVVFCIIFALLVLFFRDTKVEREGSGMQNVLNGFLEVFRQGPDVIRIMFMIAIMELPWSMAQPFLPLFAHQYKAADEFLLGAIAVARMLVPLVFSILIGRLADRHGRKKLLFAIAPLAYLGSLCLIFANGPLMLLASGFLFGFNSINMALATAMSAEIMPKDRMGRWIGIVSLIRGLVSIPAPMLGGFIWNHLGPHYVFVGVICLDLFVRLPLLSSVRETLTRGNGANEISTV
jgi:MFS family permease